MTMKNDAQFEKELNCHFKTDMRNLTNFDPNTPKFKKIGLLWPKYVCAKKSTEELCLMEIKIYTKFEGKLTCAFKNDMKNLANFHRLKNSDFILESKMSELNQNKNSKQPIRPDAVWKLYFSLEINEVQLTKPFIHVLQNRCS